MADKKNKTGGKFKAFLRAVFVKNIDLKIFAVLFAVIVTLLVAGLGGKATTDRPSSKCLRRQRRSL